VASARKVDRLRADAQEGFDFDAPGIVVVPPAAGLRAIEDPDFPFEVLSDTAEAESWRKEIHRPIYHIHKWWARRLGTVFRATVLASLAPIGIDILKLFYRPTRLPGAVVFDPFMGSGTTIGETLKLGARAIGRDINPVAHFLVRNAVASHDRARIAAIFAELEQAVAPQLRHFYRARMPDGREAETLYYFWVKTLTCPRCTHEVDLFGSRIFAQHAYARRNPRAQATCPACGDVNEVTYGSTVTRCGGCGQVFNPQEGPAKGQQATCPNCAHSFSIAKVAAAAGRPPRHRLYAKLVLTPQGNKVYLPADDFDRALYADAEAGLRERRGAYPIVALKPGFNTDQAIGYGYRYWHEFFNARQLLGLAILADAIRAIADRSTRELFACLFSGTLEFNNMFASYKGEGTGAVRHMFAHHILKPERTPLEANIWGTPASSGAFSTLYRSRILRALDYADAPTELRADERGAKAAKISGLSDPIGYRIAESFAAFAGDCSRVYLSCGDSANTDLEDASVDAVVTDPPFYDNVHYSQLADFFHVWQRHLLGADGTRLSDTTRASGEVQDEDEFAFTRKLAAVFAECRRVLKDDGVLVFTYHHSRPEGWSSVLEALMQSGFCAVIAHPIKSEMAVAMPKVQASQPIDLDIILVCRKHAPGIEASEENLSVGAADRARRQIARLAARGRRLSRNDVRVIVMAQVLCVLSRTSDVLAAMKRLRAWETQAETLISTLHAEMAGGRRATRAA
jgi:putative DNA methylase